MICATVKKYDEFFLMLRFMRREVQCAKMNQMQIIIQKQLSRLY